MNTLLFWFNSFYIIRNLERRDPYFRYLKYEFQPYILTLKFDMNLFILTQNTVDQVIII